jgi:hypothetical protein
MRRNFGLSKELFGLLLILAGGVVTIIGAVLAFPALLAVVFGGVTSGQGLGVLGLAPLGAFIMWLGTKLQG